MAYQAIGMLNQKINEAQMITHTFAKEKNVAEEASVPLWKRYALSIPEAAKYFGIGEKRLYQIIAENEGADFILEIGSHIKIKRELFGSLHISKCGVLPVNRTIKNNKFLYRQPIYGWRYF